MAAGIRGCDRRGGRRPAPSAVNIRVEVRVSANGRSVAQLRGVSTSADCFDLTRLQQTDGRGCASFSVYDVSSGRLVLGPVTPAVGPGDPAINADGSLIAVVGGYDGDLVLYRVADGAQLGRVAGPARPGRAEQLVDTAAVTFGKDGLVYVGSMAGPIRVIDPGDLDVVRTINAPPFSSNPHVSVGSDGVVVAAGDKELVAAETSTGAIRWNVDIRGTHPQPCPFFASSVSAGRLYCGNYFGVIEERDRATGQRTGNTLDPNSAASVRWRSPTTATSSSRSALKHRPCRGGGSTAADPSPARSPKDTSPTTATTSSTDPPSSSPNAARLPTENDLKHFVLWNPATDKQVDPRDSVSAPGGSDETPSPAASPPTARLSGTT